MLHRLRFGLGRNEEGTLIMATSSSCPGCGTAIPIHAPECLSVLANNVVGAITYNTRSQPDEKYPLVAATAGMDVSQEWINVHGPVDDAMAATLVGLLVDMEHRHLAQARSMRPGDRPGTPEQG